MRISLGIEYDGTNFSGWQIQGHACTIQGRLEEALSKVADHRVRVSCAGRTDAGVHAQGQVVHFDTDVLRNMHSWVAGTNANLPHEICVLWAQVVSTEFHARYSAVSRYYRYVIFNRKVRPSFLASRVAWDYRPLDESRMSHAARYLIGEHDFTSFRDSECQARSPVRNVMRLDVSRQGELIFLDVVANAFLHHMVRNIAGVLMDIGAGKKEPEWVKQVLDAKDRRLGGGTAPPGGLYLMSVEYPADFSIPHLPQRLAVW